MKMIERVARALCEAEGYKPDQLEPGDSAGIDGYISNGDPAHFLWREWSDKARAAIEAMREPTTNMREAGDDTAGTLAITGDYSAELTWQKMIDAALGVDTPAN